VSAPAVGICAAIERVGWGVWRDYEVLLAPRKYATAVQRAGGTALLLAPDEAALEDPDALLDRIDTLILAGGADIDPASYGAEPHAETIGSWPERDRFELALARRALERDMPVLGICRGMQILNVALGGTLVQDLVAPDGSHPHRKFKGTFEGNSHTVRLEPGSLAERAVGEHEHVAHCHHHQSVLALGDGLVVTGRAEDGVVEAIESAEGHWALGVQWHPEADDRSRLFGALCDAARAYAARDGHRISKPPSPSGSSSRTSTVSTSA
jgi:putative glutamine amidotransferase